MTTMSAYGSLPSHSLEDAMAWVRDLLGDVELDHARSSVRGSQAEIRFVQGTNAPGREMVLKVLVDANQSRTKKDSSWTLKDEFDALTAMHPAFASRTDIDCPQPVALHPGHRAYLMTKVEGRPLDHVDLSTEALGRTIDLLLEALSLYYDAVGDIYGDLQPSNVIVADGSIALIDPTLPARVHRTIETSLTCAPASSDIGYWTYSVVSRSFAGAIRHPRVAARRARATRLLLERAPRHFGADPVAFGRDISHAVKTRLARLARFHPVKGRALQVVGGMTLARLQRGLR